MEIEQLFQIVIILAALGVIIKRYFDKKKLKKNRSKIDSNFQEKFKQIQNDINKDQQLALRSPNEILKRADKKSLPWILMRHLEAVAKSKNVNSIKDALALFTKEERAFYVVAWIDSEINNGGFVQLYFNNTVNVVENAPDHFELLGLSGHAESIRKSNEIYFASESELKRKEQETQEEFSERYKNDPYVEAATDYKESGNVEEVLAEYITNNPNAFISEIV